MTWYSYSALNNHGQISRGKISCADKNHLRAELLRSGLLLVRGRRCWRHSFSFRIGCSNEFEELALQLELQLHADISLLDSLLLISQTRNSQVAALASRFLDGVREGQNMSTIAAARPDSFGHLAPALFGVGEQTGNMADAVAEIHRSLEHDRICRQRLRQAMIYPVMVSLSLLVVVIFMLFRVIPDLVDLLTNLNTELPLATRVLLHLSEFTRQYAASLLLAVIVLLIAFATAWRYRRVRLRLQQWQLEVPVLGVLLLEIRLARFAKALAYLLTARVNLLEALSTARPVLGLEYLEAGISAVETDVVGGLSLSTAIHQRALFPKAFVRLLEIGESAGSLAPMLHHAAHYYDRGITLKLQRLEVLSASLLLVAMGGLLIGIVMSVLGPVYDSFAQLQAF